MRTIKRRAFIKQSLSAGVGIAALNRFPRFTPGAVDDLRFGLVTYLWGRDWDLQTLIANCEKTGLLGVELRTEHSHKVEINLSSAQRAEVRKRFADSPVECIGYGSNFEFTALILFSFAGILTRQNNILYYVMISVQPVLKSNPTIFLQMCQRRRLLRRSELH